MLILPLLIAGCAGDVDNQGTDAVLDTTLDHNTQDLAPEFNPDPVDIGDVVPVPGGCWPEWVNHTPCPGGPCSCVEFTGNLSDGLEGQVQWLVDQECIPQTRQPLFAGKHVFYATELSPWCGVNACVTPDDPDVELGIYAVRLEAQVCQLPPDPGTFFECDGAWDQDSSMPYADDIWSQSCPDFNTIKASNTRCVIVTSGIWAQNYLVGVTGPADQTSAGFTLHFGWRYDCGT